MGYILYRFFVLLAFLITAWLLAYAVSYLFSFENTLQMQVQQWSLIAAIIAYMVLLAVQRVKKIKAGRA